MSELNREDRVRGCLLGLSVGDALGAPLEGLTAQQIRSHYGLVVDYVDGSRAWKKKPFRWRMPGLYTDDTQQALALSDVMLEYGAVEPERLADLYLRLATPKGTFVGAHRGVGKSFRAVITKLEAGVSPRETGEHSAGIGAAMRIAPVALYFSGGADTADAMFESVMASSLMTHRDVRSLAGALTVVHALCRVLDGEPLAASMLFRLAGDVTASTARLIERYPESVEVGLHVDSLPRAIAHVESVLDKPRDQAMAALVEEANRHGASPTCKSPTMGFPPACIPTCLYLLMTTDSFEDALIEIVNLGGDADTAGAILGAMAGALHGVDAIPERWLDRLQNRDGIDARARALAARSARDQVIPDLVTREHSLSRDEVRCRENLRPYPQNGGDLGANRRV